MEDKNRRLEELLQTPCYSIDFLPQPIPPAALSQFRTIQHHLLNSEKRQEIKNRIVNILLKLLCFFPACVLWDGWKEQPNPYLIEQAVDTVMENHSGSLYLLFWQEESLLVFEWRTAAGAGAVSGTVPPGIRRDAGAETGAPPERRSKLGRFYKSTLIDIDKRAGFTCPFVIHPSCAE